MLLAMMAPIGASASTSANTARFASGLSYTASTISSASATVSAIEPTRVTTLRKRSSVHAVSASPASRSVASAPSMRAPAFSSVAKLLSVTRTWWPPSAKTSANEWPMRPAPRTATRIVMPPTVRGRAA